MVYGSADAGQAELVSLSQVCYSLFGYSVMREKINLGLDVHLDFAADMMGIDYETAKANKKRPDVDEHRQIAKCGDFGFPGGSGPDAFLDFARKTYGVIMTREKAVALKKAVLIKWPEWKDYFRWVDNLLWSNGNVDSNGMLRGYIKGFVPDGVTGLWRGGVAYTEACNHPFQHLTAAAMKAACFEVAKACYIIKSSPLYGCRPVMFVHDEIIAEMPEAQAPYAVEEMSRIIVETYQRYTP